MNSNEPLAFRMRPKTLDEYVGQEHVLGKDKMNVNLWLRFALIKLQFLFDDL